jgi:phosphotriesterase-related protein
MVTTVLGEVDADDLGLTLVHEHLLLGWPGADTDTTFPYDRDEAIRICTDRAEELVAQGVRTIVDPCPIELGRDPELSAEVSRRSGLQVVVATGLYNEELGFPHYYRERSVEELTEIFLAELTEGIGRTDIRAGVVKVAAGATVAVAGTTAGDEIGAHEQRAHRAAARASAATGVPILTHNNELAPAGRVQTALFREEGADPDRVLIGHAGGVGDLRYHTDVLAAGASLGFDRFGVESLCPDALRVASLVGLARTGHLGRLFVSTDAVMCWRGRASPFLEKVRRRSPSWHARHVVDGVLPMLREAGLSEAELDTLMVANPRRLFGG